MMEGDKPERNSGSDVKGNSSSNGENGSKLTDENEGNAVENRENDPVRVLQLSQPFFVADTLEDDSLIILPTQEDSVPFLIPSTPCSEKSDKKEQPDPNDSTISILEETCVDFDNKAEHNSSKEDEHEQTCNESDLTQDLELDATQPIILSTDAEKDVDKEPDIDKKNEDEEEEDNEWQLKFSESITPDALLQYNKEDDEEDKSEKAVAEIDTRAEDSVPETLTIGIEDSPKKDEKSSFNDSSVKIIESNEPHEMETQSDDEIEPSQSCLSEYKGETISTSFKMQSSMEPPSIEEIPKLNLETESNGEKMEDILEEDDQDITIISDDDSSFHAKDIVKKSSISVIPVDDTENFDKVIVRDTDELDELESIKAELIKWDAEKTAAASKVSTQLPENVCGEVTEVKDSEECIKESKDSTQLPGNQCKEAAGVKDSEELKDSTQLKKIECKKVAEVVQDSEECDKEVKLNKEIVAAAMEVDDDRDVQEPQKKPKKVRKGEKITERNSRKDKIEETKDKENIEQPKSSEISMIVIGDSENDSKTVKDDGIIEMMDTKEVVKGKTDNVSEEKEKRSTDIQICEAELQKDSQPGLVKKLNLESNSKKAESSKIESQPIKPSQESVVLLDSEAGKSSDIPQDKVQITGDKPETPPTSMLPPKSTKRGYGSARKQKLENRSIYHDSSPVEKSGKKSGGTSGIMGSYTDIISLENLLKSLGITLENETMETILSKSNEEVEIRPVFILHDLKMRLKEYSVEFDHHRLITGISPISSNSTATSSTLSLKASSIHSGEMADISSSLSSKSVNSCGIQVDSAGQSINFLSSQESFPKTSTQKSQVSTGFSAVFGKKEPAEKSETDMSPIPSNQTAKAVPQKRKRGAKKGAESSSTENSVTAEPKRKRGRAIRAKPVIKEEKSEETEESKDAVVADVKPKKATRRKKGTVILPDKKPEEVKVIAEKFETLKEDDSGTAQDEGNFGSIVPGVKVMARWKDGYYYSGIVESQELDGKWAVLFEDGFLRTITPENLIKIAILPKGTSVLVQSPDDFYDPGIVCGHFREGNKVGYEVELDNGVTRRYSRSSVILSGDQAKLITSNRPPTTPATMTINLDNIVEGKRKRKSIQSPVADPVVKKSPRVTRSKKPDSNLDSTAESSAAEVATVVLAKDSDTTEAEEPVKKKRKAGRRAAAKSNISDETSNSSTRKNIKILPQRSAKNNNKLFKDYAFLLTNADRKIIPKTDASDYDNKTDEDDIVPFDKDDLCSHIATGGGMILEKFDDIKKCNRKHIYLLANSYLRTMKYIQCIAAGISCIKHHWVQNCIFKAEILDLKSYILPSGFSLVKQQIIEWHGKTDVFKTLKIALVSAPESPFVYTWAPVLLAAKADFVQKWSLPTSVSGCSLVVDVLITNNHCPLDIIHSAKKRKIPIVSSEWIIQCLIMGKWLAYDAHLKFRYDFTEI